MLIFCCTHAFSQNHLSLCLDLVEDEHYIPYFKVSFKNISNDPIQLSNSSVKEIKKIGRLVVGDNTVCCFKNVSKSGKLFYGGSFIMDRRQEIITINPGEEISFQTKIAGAGMPFDGAISFHNEEAKNFSKISCYAENIVYSTSDGKMTPRFNLESNSIDIVDIKIYDNDFMNISLRQNGEVYSYVLLFNGRLIPRQVDDFELLYNRILKKRGFSAIKFEEVNNTTDVYFSSGSVNISENFMKERISPDKLADLYVCCIMGSKYKTGNRPYQLDVSSGQVQLLNNKLPRTYINHLIAALQEALAIDGIYYKISQAKKQNITNSLSHWQNELANNNCY